MTLISFQQDNAVFIIQAHGGRESAAKLFASIACSDQSISSRVKAKMLSHHVELHLLHAKQWLVE